MTTADDSLDWTYAVLGAFAEGVQVGELALGLDYLAGLSEYQRVDIINNCLMLLDRSMADEIPGAPSRLSTFGGITIPAASELDVRGFTTSARSILVATWNGEEVPLVTNLVERRGTQYAVGVVALAAACMLLTWQLETGQSLDVILDSCPSG